MKPSILTLALLLLIAVPSYSKDASDNARNLPVTSYSGTFSYQAAEPVNITFDGFALVADSGSLKEDIAISLSVIPYKGGYTMPSNMENVCLLNDGVRLLPNGEQSARISDFMQFRK